VKKHIKQAIMVFSGSCLMAAGVFIFEQRSEGSISQLQRNSYGQGNRTEELEVAVEGLPDQQSVQIEVEERRYNQEEIKAVFQEVMDQLDTLILGDNASLDHVESGLNLITSIPDQSISVEWETNHPDIVTVNGEIREDNVEPEGSLVELRAVLRYGEEEAMHVTNVVVYPKTLHEEEALLQEIEREIKEINKLTIENEEFLLPILISGKTIQWYQKGGRISLVILLFGIAGGAYFILIEKQNRQKEEKKRQVQLLADYPEIVNKLVLLIGAGLPVQKAWYKVAAGYEEQKDITGIRYAYEEMIYTWHELQSKMPEGESYERFGRRCGLTEYIKFGALLSQNLKKGTAGLTKMLTIEAGNAFEERKARARRKGEEAGTKLLLPMFLMLVIVLIIIIVPAFLSFQL